MGALPGGTVTLVLGDVESSTRRWETAPEAMATAMRELHSRLDELVDAHRGARPLEQGEGDSFVAAFARASDAVAFATALVARSPLPVRIGVHTGEVEVVDDGYAGPTIIRAARIRDAGHGGQVLLSQTTAALVADAVDLDDLGEHQLKGLSRPERIWQLPGEFPPLRLSEDATAIPRQVTRFIGRDLEMHGLRDLLKESGCVTLTGAGGAGKTRLALELATERGNAAKTPSWFVDLAAIDRDDAVAIAVADALRAHVLAHRSVTDAVAAIVRDRDALLVLDNCEHVLSACSALAVDLLGRCPQLTIIATSREPLGLAGEVTYRVPSLAEDEAVALFVERAQRANPRFALDDANAQAVSDVCARLDGMPLAIELAAARIRVFSPAQLLEALHDRFRLLTGGARSALPRQRTLEASVDWSYALLLDAERTLLRRLSVFAGGFTLDAAVAVATDGDLDAHHVFDLLVALVEKSLVTADESESNRFRLLETIRHYGSARLVDAGEAEACRRRHYDHYLRVVVHDDSGSQHELAHLRTIRAEAANLRRALQWAADQQDYEALVALALPTAHYWRYGRAASEAATLMRQVEARTKDAPARVRARVLTELASALSLIGAWAESSPYAHEALALSEGCDDVVRMHTLIDCFVTLLNAERVDTALLDEAIEITRRLDEEKMYALAISYRAFYTMRDEGDFPRAAPMLEEGLVLARKHGIDRLEGVVLAWLYMGGAFTRGAAPGDFDRAATILHETGQGMILANLYAIGAVSRLAAGDEAGSARDLHALDTIALEMNDLSGRMMQMIGYGFVALLRGEFAEAVRQLYPFSQIQAGEGMAKSIVAILAMAEALLGNLDDAEVHADSAAESTHDAMGLLFACVAVARAEVAHGRGDHATAWDVALAATTNPAAAQSTLTPALVGLVGRSAFHLGRPEEAVRVMAAAGAADPDVSLASQGMWRALFDETTTQARAQLGDERFDALWAEGAALSESEALALVQRGRGSRKRPMLGWESLTPTEADVARLVAQGASNKEVAAQMFMSEATVKTHLTHIYAKVGVSNRAQLAAASRTS